MLDIVEKISMQEQNSLFRDYALLATAWEEGSHLSLLEIIPEKIEAPDPAGTRRFENEWLVLAGHPNLDR